MNADDPHYRVYGYHGDIFSFEWTTLVDGPSDSRFIEKAREQITPENMPDTYCWADLFYCHGSKVRLVGTWVIEPGIEEQPSANWHADGWAERPTPSKENALRYLHGLGRPV